MIFELKEWLNGRIQPLERVVDVMTDAGPKNLDQLKTIWESEKEPLVDDSLEAAILIIEQKVNDSITRDGIVAMLQSVIDVDLDGDREG